MFFLVGLGPWKPDALHARYCWLIALCGTWLGMFSHCAGMIVLWDPMSKPPIMLNFVALQLWKGPGAVHIMLVWLSSAWLPHVE